MKQITLLLLAFLLINKSNAQGPNIVIEVEPTNFTVTDLSVVLHVTDVCGNIVGTSKAIPVSWTGNQTFTYAIISGSPGWSLDPGDCGINYDWAFSDAELFNCIGVLSTGSAFCSGNYDWGYTIGVQCPSATSGCFEYSNSGCAAGNAGVIIDFNINNIGACTGNPNGHLRIQQL